jgi:citrate lyase subunit beta/citryl-CoA lyase
MPDDARPRRSVLFVPGSNARALEKAKGLPADGLIFDLEDAVAPSVKVAARDQVLAAIRRGGWGSREIVLRINGPDTPWGADDLAAAARSGADAVLLPKVESSADVRTAERALLDHGAPDGLLIWCMIETPLGVLRAAEIAGSSSRLVALVVGTSDLAKDLGARSTPGRLELLTSLSLCVLAARGHSLAVLDGVHLDLQDDAGFAEACRQAVELGFDGKTLIHPRTIETANRIFAPSADDIDWSRRVIEAHAEAEDQGRGVAVLEGRLIERLHVERARRLLAQADAIARREQEAQP